MFNKMDQSTLSFLALGDSYTIGEAVPENDRWPVQLVEKLKVAGISVADPEIIATTGWTTDELQKAIGETGDTKTYDLLSLLIGVNNQYRGYDLEVYKKEFKELLDQAIAFANEKPENVFVISIPDYGVTPFALEHNLNPEKIADELDQYNLEAQKIAQSKGVAFFDITEWSKGAKADPSLVTSDGLHPSGKMYANWVDTCYAWVYENLSCQ